MSEVTHIGSEKSFPESDKLLKAVSGLAVPLSSISKEEMWSKINQGVNEVEKYNRLRLRLMKWSAAAIVLIAVTSGILEWQFAMKTVKAPAGKIAQGMLPDSSTVTLNAGSKIKHREFSFTKNRIVKLTGEAFFDVRRGESDFVVIAGKNTIKVVGTKFNVLYRSNQLSVECLSGEVVVSSNSTIVEKITEGRGIIISTTSINPILYDVDFDRAASWVRGEHFFSNTPLSVVFQELERQFDLTIKHEGFDPSSRFYSGYFTTHSLNHALELVCLPMNLNYEVNQKKRVVKIVPK